MADETIEVAYADKVRLGAQPQQDGSRFSFGSVPCGLTFEEAHAPSGDRFIVYVLDTPMGRLRFAFNEAAVEDHHVNLGRLLGKPHLQVARATLPPRI